MNLTITKSHGFRDLNADEIDAVAGGWLDNPTIHGSGGISPVTNELGKVVGWVLEEIGSWGVGEGLDSIFGGDGDSGSTVVWTAADAEAALAPSFNPADILNTDDSGTWTYYTMSNGDVFVDRSGNGTPDLQMRQGGDGQVYYNDGRGFGPNLHS